jgi:hypothetical protein
MALEGDRNNNLGKERREEKMKWGKGQPADVSLHLHH